MLPDKGQTLEQVKDLFWKICKNGLVSAFDELCVNTEAYFKEFERNIKVNRFLENYDGLIMTLKMKQRESKYNNSY